MKITNIKKIGKDKYKLEFSDFTELKTYDEIILKYNLLFNKEIDNKMLSELENETKEYESYNKVLKYITTKMRSNKEIEGYMNKLELNKIKQEEIKNRLKSLNLINDEAYVKAFINDKLNLTSMGPNKIKQELYHHDIEPNVIEKYIDNIDENEVKEKLTKLISKKINSNTNKSFYMLKQKLNNYFYNLGYDSLMINEVLNNHQSNDQNLIKKEYDKLYKKYSKKYQGNELEYKIKNALFSKGFNTTDLKD